MDKRKRLLAVGWIFVGIVLLSYVVVMLIAVLQGNSLMPVKIVPGGRGGAVFPIMIIPLLLGLIVVAAFWIFRRIRQGKIKSKHRLR